jgi:hypothetical protein
MAFITLKVVVRVLGVGMVLKYQKKIVDLVIIKYQLAESLNLFKLDFYNDWVHGSLFSFLVIRKKLKENKNGEEKFCEYECYDGNFTPIDGAQ